MSFAGDLPADGSGLDYSDIGADQRKGAAQLPFMDSLGDAAGHAFMGGVRGIADYYDLDQQTQRAKLDAQFNVDPVSDPGGALIDPKEWQSKYADLGLTFTPDMGRAQAQLLVDHRSDELRRQYVLDHSPDTFMAKTARGLTDFAVSAIDPLNVAAAFVPAVGEARAGLWAAKYGKTFARVAEGAAAGATGMAALTPIDAIEAHAYQDHYGPMDAFLNIAFGTVLGGGLHAGVGAFSDFLARAAPETREAALRSSVAQAVEGRPVDVQPILATDPRLSTPEAAPAVPPPSVPAKPAVSPADLASALEDVKASRAAAPKEPSLFNAIRDLGGIKMQDESGKPTMGAQEIRQIMDKNRSLASKTGLTPDMIREALGERGWFGGNRDTSITDLSDLHSLIEQEAKGNKVYHPESTIHGDLAYRELLDRETTEAGISANDKPDVAARKLAEYRAERGADLARRHEESIGQDFEGLSSGGQEALQSHGYEPGSDIGAEFEDQAGGVGQGAGGQESVAGGSRQGGQDAGQAGGRGALPPESRGSIDRARQNSIDFARGAEQSPVAASPEESAHADAIIRAGDDPETEMADAMQQLQDYKEQGVISDGEMAALDAGNKADDEVAKDRIKTARALAQCLFMTP